jgi:curved DNA-binding protein CbpA
MEDMEEYYSKTNKKDKKILKKKKKEKKNLENEKNWEIDHDASIKQMNLDKQKQLEEKLKEVNYLLSKPDLPDPQKKKLTIMRRIIRNELKEVKENLESSESSFGWVMFLVLFLGVFGLGVMKYNEEFYSDWDFSLDNDFYKTLELDHAAPLKEVKKAYRTLMKKFHPDRNPDCQECPRKVYKIQQAYDTLGKPDKKELYDQNNGAFNSISSKATELTLKNFSHKVDSFDGIGVFQIYDSSQRSQRFGSFYEEMIEKLDYLDFFRVNSKAQGKLLGKLPYGSPILPFVYFVDGHNKSNDILDFDEMTHRNPVKDLMKSLLNFIPKNYDKVSEEELLKRGEEMENKYGFIVRFDNINKKSNEVKLRLLYSIMMFDRYFNKKTLLVDTSKGSKARSVSFKVFNKDHNHVINLLKVPFRKALILTSKIFFINKFNQNKHVPEMHKKSFQQMCKSKLAKMCNLKCFLFFKQNEVTEAIFSDSQKRNNDKLSQLLRPNPNSKQMSQLLTLELEVLGFVDTQNSQFLFQKFLKQEIKTKVLQKANVKKFSQSEEVAEAGEIDIEAELSLWGTPAFVYTHSRDGDVLIETSAVEMEDTLEDILTSKMDFQKIFPQLDLSLMLLPKGESMVTLFLKCYYENLVKFDLMYWTMLGVLGLMMWKFSFSGKTGLLLFLSLVLVLACNQFRVLIY